MVHRTPSPTEPGRWHPGHDAARDYLVAQLTAIGLQPELQTTTSVLRFEGADSFGTGMVPT